MLSSQIRSTFLDFFTSRGHRLVPASPLIPSDPTLLLTNAGMNQFVPYFVGEATPEFRRATSVQKCVRTVDIDNVGRTARHATFFEMLGNFSFGNYFKAETIAFAWELLTEHYRLDPGRLWATVYADDDEAYALWRGVGLPDGRIQRLGADDNYWSMGVPGPCGPCSDVCYDRGPAFGPGGGPAANGERYLEIWSLVFMQHLRGEAHGDGRGGLPIVGDLPARCIDTGIGLDRLAAVLQDVETVCETDLLAPTLRRAQELAGRPYPGRDGSEASVSFRVVTEHARCAAFLIADGVLPSNEGRGYVLRRLLRRAVRHARLLSIEGPTLAPLTGTVVDTLGGTWPELRRQASLIAQVVAAEEEAFDRTLRQGSRLLQVAITRAAASGSDRLSGETAFELHDTHGFPLDLTVEVAREAGLSVDEERFAALLEDQRRRAQRDGRARTVDAVRRLSRYREIAARHGRTEFVGYDATEAEARVLALLRDGEQTPAAGAGEEVEVILDRSPFYAEAGGQVGDTGALRAGTGADVEILDTRPGADGLYVHIARIRAGEVRTGQEVLARVDAPRRQAVARSHTATHVLHAVLRRALGEHAGQQGSLVAPGRLRFDFAHFSALDAGKLAEVEQRVNDYLLDDPDVRVWHADRAEAGAAALFGERYGERVRVVDIGDLSRELCGGTHVGHGCQAWPVRILGESSIGASLRRIEALTGRDALRHYDHERRLLEELAGLLRTPPGNAPDALRKHLAALAEARRELDRLRAEELAAAARRVAGQARQVVGGWVVAARVPDTAPDELRTLAQGVLRDRTGTGAVVLGTAHEGKAVLVAVISPDLAERGGQARELLAGAAAAVGGGAGGKGGVAGAGGRHPERLDRALAVAAEDAAALLAQGAPL